MRKYNICKLHFWLKVKKYKNDQELKIKEIKILVLKLKIIEIRCRDQSESSPNENFQLKNRLENNRTVRFNSNDSIL